MKLKGKKNDFCSCICLQEIDNVAVTSEEKVVSLNLTGLWDSTEYSVAVRCIGVESKFWSEWCREKTASTEDKGRVTMLCAFLWVFFEELGFNNSKQYFHHIQSIEFIILLFKQNKCVFYLNIEEGKLQDR